MGKLALNERSLFVKPCEFLDPFPQRDLFFNELAETCHDSFLPIRPLMRLRIDGAERPQYVAVASQQGNTEVSADIEIRNRKIVADERISVASSITSGEALATTCWQNE